MGHQDTQEQSPLLARPAPASQAGDAPAANAQALAHLQPSPIPGLPMDGPISAPLAGEVLLGYEVVETKSGFRHMSATGVLSTIILAFVCWPLAFVPCCLSECHETFQRPVYGRPVEGYQISPPVPQYVYPGQQYPQQYPVPPFAQAAVEPPLGYPAGKQ